jgi:hypothetical protein
MIKIKKIKIKFRINVIKSIYLLAIVFFSAILISFSLFLYNSFYLSFVKISDIYELQNRVSLEAINIEKFEEVKWLISEKQSVPFSDFNLIKNPFE